MCLTEAKSYPLPPDQRSTVWPNYLKSSHMPDNFYPSYHFNIHTNQFSHSADGDSKLLRNVEIYYNYTVQKPNIRRYSNTHNICTSTFNLLFSSFFSFVHLFIHSFFYPFTSLCFSFARLCPFLFVFENKLIRKILEPEFFLFFIFYIT